MSLMTDIRTHGPELVHTNRALRGVVVAIAIGAIGLGVALAALGSDDTTRFARPVSIEQPSGSAAQIAAGTQPGVAFETASGFNALAIGSGTSAEAARFGLATQPGVSVETANGFDAIGVDTRTSVEATRVGLAAQPGVAVDVPNANVPQVEVTPAAGLISEQELAELLALR